MFNLHVSKYTAEAINSRNQSLFLQCSVKVGICTNSDLFLTLFKYTIVDPENYDFSSDYILIVTISYLLSHLSKKKLYKDSQARVVHPELSCTSPPLRENTIFMCILFPFPRHFLFKSIHEFSPSDLSGAGCSFRSCHRCYPLIAMANQMARQPAPIIKMTQISSPAMSQYIHSTYTDMA